MASGNSHKKQEIEQLFPNHTFVLPKERGINFNPEETGSSFFENSLLKAEELWKIVQKPVLADDSGICVSILNNRPGIFSARYCGKNVPAGSLELSPDEQNRLLIEEVNDEIIEKNFDKLDPVLRRCFYVCSMVFYYGDFTYASVQETLEGSIVSSYDQQKGTGGFGYDPIVYLKNYDKTVSELPIEEKNRISHRGKACSLLRPLIDAFSMHL